MPGGTRNRIALQTLINRCSAAAVGPKVNAELLTRVLDDLVPVVRDDAALFRVPKGKIMLHSVDFFRSHH